MKFLKILLVCTFLVIMCQSNDAKAIDSYDDFIGTFTLVENAKEFKFLKIENRMATIWLANG